LSHEEKKGGRKRSETGATTDVVVGVEMHCLEMDTQHLPLPLPKIAS
jgi:hypothetical protein